MSDPWKLRAGRRGNRRLRVTRMRQVLHSTVRQLQSHHPTTSAEGRSWWIQRQRDGHVNYSDSISTCYAALLEWYTEPRQMRHYLKFYWTADTKELLPLPLLCSLHYSTADHSRTAAWNDSMDSQAVKNLSDNKTISVTSWNVPKDCPKTSKFFEQLLRNKTHSKHDEKPKIFSKWPSQAKQVSN